MKCAGFLKNNAMYSHFCRPKFVHDVYTQCCETFEVVFSLVPFNTAIKIINGIVNIVD